jgi:GNAT superfamily N-acetyltransferase
MAGACITVINSNTAMIRLTADLYPNVAALYDESGLCFPLIRAVIDRLQRGSIWADDPARPATAFVVTAFGFTCLVGVARVDTSFDQSLQHLLTTPGDELPGYLLWYAPPPAWRAWLDGRLEGSFRRRERVRLRWDGDEPADVIQSDGLRLAPLDIALIPEVDKLGLRMGSRFWSSPEDLLAHGFGACLIDGDGAVISVCYASCVADNRAEIDIATRDDRRGRGYAGIVAREFVRQCRRRRILPTWDCFTANEASLRLAGSLGFVEAGRYPLYSFKTPLPGVMGSDGIEIQS